MFKKTLVSIFLILPLAFLTFSGAICKEKQSSQEEVELVFWGLWDNSEVFDPIVEAYKKENKNVTITYRKKNIENYEEELLDALATPGKGPDIFIINNTWMPEYEAKVVPFPKDIIDVATFREKFVDVAAKDFILENQIYSLPISVNTLSIFYNKEILNTAGITQPPETWSKFQDDVAKMTQVDDFGDISLAGSAIGTSQNVNRASDILALLMLQSGTSITDPETSSSVFNRSEFDESNGEEFNPGVNSLTFYTDFASSSKRAYTWNLRKSNSVDSFINGETGMIFGYSYLIPSIQAKAPKLNFAIASAPQINPTKKKVAYANYWSPVVSKNITEDRQKVAQDFLKFLTLDDNVYKAYLDESGSITSRRDFIAGQKTDPLKKPFAEQALYAESWYQPDAKSSENIFNEMINSVNLGSSTVEEATLWGASQIDLLFRKMKEKSQENNL